MKHSTKLISVAEGLEVHCSDCGKLPGIFFTRSKALASASAHKKLYTSDEAKLKLVKPLVEAIAKRCTTFAEFQSAVRSNRDINTVVGPRTIETLIQHSEAGMLLD